MKVPASTISVTIGFFQRPDFAARAFTSSAIFRCSGEVTKMAERYCVPTSLPWRFFVVGSCMRKNHFSSRSAYESLLGSNTTRTDSAWPVVPVVHVLVRRVRGRAARVADLGLEHARDLAQELLHAPEAAARQDAVSSVGFAVGLALRVGAALSPAPSRACGEERAVRAVALGLELVRRDEAQRRRVDAVAQVRRRRAVVEHVAEVRVAALRAHLGPRHAVACCRCFSTTRLGSTGCVKLGQPVPESNLSVELNSGSPVATST